MVTALDTDGRCWGDVPGVLWERRARDQGSRRSHRRKRRRIWAPHREGAALGSGSRRPASTCLTPQGSSARSTGQGRCFLGRLCFTDVLKEMMVLVLIAVTSFKISLQI